MGARTNSTILWRRPLRRRHLFSLAGGAALAGALPAAAQRRFRIAYLAERGGPNEFEQKFIAGLRERGWVEGAQVGIDFRWAGGDAQRMRTLANELLALAPEVVVATDVASVRAVRSLDSAIPIVHPAMADPIASGMSTSLARPDRNVTGISVLATELGPKRVELLKEVMPGLRRIGTVVNAVRSPQFGTDTRNAAQALGLSILDMRLAMPDGIDAGYAAAVRDGVQALVVVSDTSTITYRQALCDAALKHRLPTIYANRTYIRGGGLMSYGPDLEGAFHRAAYFVDRILKGARPADLPIEQPTTFQLVVNQRIARAIGLTIPQLLLLRADEVIE